MPAENVPLATARDFAEWLTSHLATTRGLSRSAIDPSELFSRYGLDSLGAGRLVADLSAVTGKKLSPALVWEYPTIAALSEHLSGGGQKSSAAGRRRTTENGATDSHEPIAVIGVAARLPGAPDADAFWRLLAGGKCAVGDVPEGRWEDRVLRDVAVGADERKKVRRGAFLDRVDGFDPLFFGVSPREAAAMDPQQRLLLELTWEALEDAGIRPSALKGSSAAVLVGAIWQDYAHLSAARGGLDGIGPYTVTGNHHSILANRISYLFGLHGPSFAIDSACSSGLVIAHLAAESLRSGESTLAIVGGVNLDLLAESALGVARFGALSPDGTCYTFDSRANGYVRGEGGAVLLLKRLSRAVADGDPVHCVLRGSAVNNDGASNGLTAPNPKAQVAVLESAYRRAGVDPADVQYVEAHGTGTSLGDPIELRALGAVVGQGRSADDPLLVGSAKTNIGHLEGAAGAAGLLKVALSMRHRLLPPSLHFESPNPHADLAELHLEVPTRLRPWPHPEKRLVAGVSSFGLGGTNSHVVVEEWPSPPAEAIRLSAADGRELRRHVEALRADLDGESALLPLSEVALRTHSKGPIGGAESKGPIGGAESKGPIGGAESKGLFESEGPVGATIVARSHRDLAATLDRWLAGQPGPSVHVSGEGRVAPPPAGPVFVFPGQGAQWHGMAVSLLHREPVFRSVIERCDAAIRRELGWSLVDELVCPRAASRLHDIEVSLAAIISIDVAVSAWWRSIGVEPAAVVGHSTGEIAAACVAGALDLDDTMRVICAYGRLITRQSDRGGMALVGLPWEQAESVLAGYEGKVFRAIADSAEATVLAGEPAALDALVAQVSQTGVFCRRVAMNVSPHCPLVDDLRDELFQRLRDIRPRRSRVPLFSEVTGAEVPGESLDAAHWVRNFGDPAFFSRAVDSLIHRGHRVFIDVGPHPITKHSVETNLRRAGLKGLVVSSMRRDEDERTTLLDAAATLEGAGVAVRWSEVYPDARSTASASTFVLPISARSPEALSERARTMAELLAQDSPARLRDIAYTASVRRDHHRYRAAVVGASREELREALSRLGAGESAEGSAQGEAPVSGRPKVVFVLPGQGSQWLGMGRELVASEPVFREALSACDEAIRREAGFSVLEQVAADEAASRLREIDVVQPMLFAMEVALGALWRSWGVEPDEVIGHSMGEVAAAHLAGVLSMEDAAKIICRRSKLLRRQSGRGAMALVELSRREAESALQGRTHLLDVAVSNGPRATVISGDPGALDALLSELDARGVFCRRVKVDVASHSPQMDELTDELLAALSDVKPQPGSVGMRSTVTGEMCAGPEMVASYWVQNLRRPVLFSTAVTRSLSDGPTVFVELSPHPLLLPSIAENVAEARREGTAVGSTRRDADERRALLGSLAEVYARGVPVDWNRLFPEGGRLVALPFYPFQRQSLWIEQEEKGGVALSSAQAPGLSRGLLGPLFRSSLHAGERCWEAHFDARSSHFFADHRVQEQVVFPGAGYLDMALSAGAEIAPGPATLSDVRFDRLLVLDDAGSRVQIAVAERTPTDLGVTIASRAEGQGDFRHHAAMTLRLGPAEDLGRSPEASNGDGHRSAGDPGRGADHASAVDLSSWMERCPVQVDLAEFYAAARRRGIDYGPRFRLLTELRASSASVPFVGSGSLRGADKASPVASEAVARAALPDDLDDEGHVLHPALLDACLHASLAIVPGDETYVPVRIDRIHVARRAGRTCVAHVVRAASEDGSLRFDITALSDAGEALFEVRGLTMASLVAGRSRSAGPLDGVHAIVWRPSEAPPLAPGALRGTWLVVAGRAGVLEPELCAAIREAGGQAILAEHAPSFTEKKPGHFALDASQPGQFERLLTAVRTRHKDLRGVVHCGAAAARPWATSTAGTIEDDLRLGTLAAMWMAQALLRTGARDVPRLFSITRCAQLVEPGVDRVAPVGSALWGFLKTAALEHPALECKRIDLPERPLEGEAASLVRELAADDGEDQVALRSFGRRVARLVRSRLDDDALEAESRSPAGERPFRLAISGPGTLENLSLVEVERAAPGPGEVEIAVEAAGLNFHDVLVALGVLPEDDGGGAIGAARLGWECAGRVLSVGPGVTDIRVGEEVVALAPHALGSHVVARHELCAPKPAALSWEEAATIPVVFMTAYHALHDVGRLRAAERVLVHAASGGVGLAAIQWAKHVGAAIFATAGSPEKRDLVRALGVDHVFDSRSSSFATDVRRATSGEGVDVVLNSLSGDLLAQSFDLLREDGRFVELGRRDYLENKTIGLRPFLRNLTFSMVDLLGLALRRPAVVGNILREVVGHFETGTFRPPRVTAFPISRVADAFAFMAQAKHVGKIALVLRDESVGLAPRPIRVRPERTYLLTGGLGGLGLSLAEWLVSAGARSLLLMGRRPPNEAATATIRAMESAGATVTVFQGDVSRAEDVEAVFALASRDLPPIAGVVHAAGVLDDRTLPELAEPQFWAPMRSKVFGALHLHEATRRLPLDFFLLYSSVAGVQGSRGQAAYAAANAFLDGLAHARAAEGLPATSIQWGLFSEVGLAAAAANRGARLLSQGLIHISPGEGAAFVGEVFSRPARCVGFFRWNVRQWFEAHPQVAGRPFFQELADEDAPAAARGSGLSQALAGAAPEERAGLLGKHVLELLGKVVRMDASRIDARTPFTSLGVDSLASLELRNRLEASLGLQLSAALLYTYSTPAALAGYLDDALRPAVETTAPPAVPEPESAPAEPWSPSPNEEPSTAEDAAALQQLQDFEEYLR